MSLGFESACQNVTQEALAKKVCRDIQDGALAYERCNITTPGNLTLSTFLTKTMSQTVLDVVTQSLVQVKQSDQSVGLPSPEFLKIAVLRAPIPNGTSIPEHIEGEEVVECAFRLTAYQYSNISATGTSLNVGSPSLVTLEFAQQFVQPYGPASVTLKHGDLPLLGIDVQNLMAIIAFFQSDVFTGNVTYGEGMSTSSGSEFPSGARMSLLHSNITARITEVARSMTDYTRVGPGSHEAFGSIVASVVYTRVQWAWLALALPLAEAAAAVLLLLLTVAWSSRINGLALWKSSALALLFAEYDEPVGGLLQPSLGGPEDLDEKAKVVQAQLT